MPEGTPPFTMQYCRGFQTQIPASGLRIITELQLMPAHKLEETVSPYEIQCRGLWDTGAQGSTIKDSLAQELGLPCIGQQKMRGAGGRYTAKKYLAGLKLPNNTVIPSIPLSGFPGYDDFEMLIGMDIILRGDFLVSCEKGTIHFSFQFPSVGGFYLKDIPNVILHDGREIKKAAHAFHPTSPMKEGAATPKVGRNDPCPCGSGQKYKKCCGKSKPSA